MDLNAVAMNPVILLAIAILGPLLRDLVVSVLRAQARKMKTDKDPKNDDEAALLLAAAEALEKVRVALGAKKP